MTRNTPAMKGSTQVMILTPQFLLIGDVVNNVHVIEGMEDCLMWNCRPGKAITWNDGTTQKYPLHQKFPVTDRAKPNPKVEEMVQFQYNNGPIHMGIVQNIDIREGIQCYGIRKVGRDNTIQYPAVHLQFHHG